MAGAARIVPIPPYPLEQAQEAREVRKMRIEEVKQVVKSRYGAFAETGGNRESC